MNHSTSSPICERENELVSFLYNEASESEVSDFALHLQQCQRCQQELASFGMVRESIGAWKKEALSGFVAQPVPTTVRTKSAIAALREFFDLSPLWMKGAVGFASLLFCIMTILTLTNIGRKPVPQDVPVASGYSAEQVEAVVKQRVEQERVKWVADQKKSSDEGVVAVSEPKPERRQVGSSGPVSQAAKRRPLSRSEREELAVDLRLLSTPEDGLNLLSDRMNQ